MVLVNSLSGVLVVKMKDVAELAGVSSAAVSRYLNGGYISADKAERIKQAIEQTGYVRSNQARALRTGSTKLIGVIVPKINSESVSRITAGIGKCLIDAATRCCSPTPTTWQSASSSTLTCSRITRSTASCWWRP